MHEKAHFNYTPTRKLRHQLESCTIPLETQMEYGILPWNLHISAASLCASKLKFEIHLATLRGSVTVIFAY